MCLHVDGHKVGEKDVANSAETCQEDGTEWDKQNKRPAASCENSDPIKPNQLTKKKQKKKHAKQLILYEKAVRSGVGKRIDWWATMGSKR